MTEPTRTTDLDGTDRWHLNGQLHRTDGPAIVYANGAKYWYRNGQQHRTDGAAVIHPNGTKLWYQNGRFHRTDGPAEICPDGTERWYLNGHRKSFQEWLEEVATTSQHKTLLMLKWNC